MTYELQTINEGKVDSGFRSFSLSRIISIGDYGTTPKDFCRKVYQLATRPIFATNIPVLGEEGIMDQYQINVDRLLGIMNEESPESARAWLESEDIWELEVAPKMEIPIRVSNDDSHIEIGRYLLSQNEFAHFSRYVTKGGFFGWAGWERNLPPPNWARLTKEAIERSNRRLFRLE